MSAIVHIVDDDEAIRRSLAMLTEAAGHTVETHADAESFLARLDLASAGCVVSDVRMPGFSGLQLLKTLTERAPDLPVIVMTGHGDIAMAVSALKAGAVDFLEKPFDSEAFLASVAGALALSARATEATRDLDELRQRWSRLTARESEIMTLIVRGRSNGQIADALSISIRTVENHRARVMTKMEAQGLPELVRMALRLGLE
jgi:two-component system response regulator FixJ